MAQKNKGHETIRVLVQKSWEDLESKLAVNHRVMEKQQNALGRYVDGLSPKEKLAMKVYVTDRIFEVLLHSQLDHELYTNINNSNVRV